MPRVPDSAWAFAAPAVFVVLWSTGFIAAKAGLPDAPPMTFLAIRFALVIAVMLPAALAWRVAWPAGRLIAHVAVVGVLMHGAYLGGVFASIDHGMPAGLSALIVGLQPLVTACVVGPLFGEQVRAMQWAGFVLGLVGVALVLSERVVLDGVGLIATLLSVMALAGITIGTLYQKRFCGGVDLRAGAVIQYAAAAAVVGVFAAFETRGVTWSRDLILAMGWLTLVLSVGAVSLLYILIRRGAAAKVASLFYLVPPFAALFAWALFGEQLGAAALLGMALAAIGVAMVQRA